MRMADDEMKTTAPDAGLRIRTEVTAEPAAGAAGRPRPRSSAAT